MSRAWLSTLAKYLLGIIVLGFVFWSHWKTTPATATTAEVPGLDKLLTDPIRFGPFVASTLLLAAAVLITFVRWYLLVRALELPRSFRSTFRLSLYGYFFNTLMPGAIGGDLVKAGAIVRSGERPMAGVASILFDRAIGLGGLALLMVLSGGVFYLLGDESLTTKPELFRVWRATAIGTAVAGFCWYLVRFLPESRTERFATRLGRLPIVGHFAQEAWRSVLMYRTRPKAVAIALGLTLFVHIFNVTAFDFAARVFESDSSKLPTLAEHFIIVPVVVTIRAFFPTPGGVGASEFSYGALYKMIGRSEALGVLASFATFLATILLAACSFIATQFVPADKVPDSESK